MRRSRSRGFTLIELMVAVVVILVLTLLALGSYRKYMARARATEVFAMFADIRAKEETYRAEYASYLSVSASDSDFYPVMGSAGPEPHIKVWSTTGTPAPANWVALGAVPPKPEIYCTYAVVAGNPNDWGTVASTWTQTFLGVNGAPPPVKWWVATAMCDNDGVAGTLDDDNNAKYVTSSKNTVMLDADPSR